MKSYAYGDSICASILEMDPWGLYLEWYRIWGLTLFKAIVVIYLSKVLFASVV